MNKTAIKNYAIWARVQLIEAARQRAYEYEITEDGKNDPNLSSVGGRLLTEVEKEQRLRLIAMIRLKGYSQVMEEAAYTWFNRFIALRFMEVNGFLPSKVRVFTDETGAFKPEILKEAMSIELEGLDRGVILDMLDRQDNESLYKYLLIAQCNALSANLPYMFEQIKNWTELLFPANLLRPDSVIGTMISDIPEEDWTDAVQIIGWLYQYYNSELKDETFALLKKNVKITKERIPAATQLFTPDWIVRYMVENSLGRLWISGQLSVDSGQLSVISDQWSEEERGVKEKEIADSFGWKYYIPEAPQTPEVRAQLTTGRVVDGGQRSAGSFESEELTTAHSSLATPPAPLPTEIKVIDPCMGSGHILVYAFDVLMQIYTAAGWSERDAARSILENNLYGLDIDDRAAQLAYFAVMMKARQYDRQALRRSIQPHVYAIQASQRIDPSDLRCYGPLKEKAKSLYFCFADAKEYGSILKMPVTAEEVAQLREKGKQILADCETTFRLDEAAINRSAVQAMDALLDQAEALAQKYDVVVTNPPYMGSSGMSAKLSQYVKDYYPDSKSDLFAVFIERCRELAKPNGYQAMITQHAWMFLGSFEKLRAKLRQMDIVDLAHLGIGTFEDLNSKVVQSVVFILRNTHTSDYLAVYDRLFEKQGLQESNDEKQKWLLAGDHRFLARQDDFAKIPGAPVAYWVSDTYIRAFENRSIDTYFNAITKGIFTGDNNRFLRFWHEVEYGKIQNKWYKYNKGGMYRKWYGNLEYVLNWEKDGKELRDFPGSGIGASQYFHKPTIVWTKLTSGKTGFRVSDESILFDDASPALVGGAYQYYILGFLNSIVSTDMLSFLSPTLNYQCGEIKHLPVILSEEKKAIVEGMTDICVSLSCDDWNSFETSWDFQQHPLLPVASDQWSVVSTTSTTSLSTVHCPLSTIHCPLSTCFAHWQAACEERFQQLKSNEEELNRIFIDIYGLQDELIPEVEDKDVTVRRADLGRDIRSLISYAVGCMLGRYSLDVPGLAFAGGRFSDQWAVIGGQYYRTEVVVKHVCAELQRIGCLAEGDGPGGGDLQAGQAAATGGAVCAVGSDASGGSIGSVQHRRGTAKKLYEGIRELPVDREGINGGTGNPVYDLCSPEILDAIANGDPAKLVRRGWKDAERIDWQAVHCALTTDHFPPDADGILPITDDEYFDGDIVNLFINWVRTVYGADTLEENLGFIAYALKHDTLPTDGCPLPTVNAREVIRAYFLNDFYADHLKVYQKRPIYWLFSSGKKNGFKCLVYMHRYQPDLLARIRTDYVHEQQERYRTQLTMLTDSLETAAASQRVKLNKQIAKIKDQALELQKFEEKIHHLADQMIEIDLDDGVKVNYAKFGDVLEKIK